MKGKPKPGGKVTPGEGKQRKEKGQTKVETWETYNVSFLSLESYGDKYIYPRVLGGRPLCGDCMNIEYRGANAPSLRLTRGHYQSIKKREKTPPKITKKKKKRKIQLRKHHQRINSRHIFFPQAKHAKEKRHKEKS